jgi:alkanesulfonate monooxygenase SsuD/methylene tetrahydromethanopterin reductase-like flavin-dependent oxidoreductase (luciferase family)
LANLHLAGKLKIDQRITRRYGLTRPTRPSAPSPRVSWRGPDRVFDLMHNGWHMTIATLPRRLGFFTRLLDQADPCRAGTGWRPSRSSMPSGSATICVDRPASFPRRRGRAFPAPFVFLAQVAAQTSRIRLGTGIVTLPLELPIRVAEDSAVLDLMCGGRLEVGVGGGGNLSSYVAFGQNSAERTRLLVEHLQVLRDAWAGRLLPGGKDQMYPANPSLVGRVWQATFTAEPDGRRGGRWSHAVAHAAAARRRARPRCPRSRTR